MSDNPYESPQNVEKAKPVPAPITPFVKQVLWLLFFQSCFLFFAALVLDGGRFFKISVITCIVMWIAFLGMSFMKKDESSEHPPKH
jgi:hypothetical protein